MAADPSHRISRSRWLLWPILFFHLFPASATEPPPAGPFRSAQCIECHGERSPEVHSYATSKHGVLVEIGSGPPGRAPDCIGCHSSRAHGPIAAERMDQTCHQCHSPRYVQTLRENGTRMVEIGKMKLLEAEQLLAEARKAFPAKELAEMEATYADMQRNLTNLRLGVAHQSPDYQWWHGHPALDGDLLRLKGAYDRLVRERTLKQPR